MCFEAPHQPGVGHDQHHHHHDGDRDDTIEDGAPDQHMHGIDARESEAEADDGYRRDDGVEAGRITGLGLERRLRAKDFRHAIGGGACQHGNREQAGADDPSANSRNAKLDTLESG